MSQAVSIRKSLRRISWAAICGAALAVSGCQQSGGGFYVPTVGQMIGTVTHQTMRDGVYDAYMSAPSGYKTVSTFPTATGGGAVVQSTGGRGFAVDVSGIANPYTLPDWTQLYRVRTYQNTNKSRGDQQLVVLQGAKADCHHAFAILDADSRGVKFRTFESCDVPLTVTESETQRLVFSMPYEDGPHVVYSNGRLSDAMTTNRLGSADYTAVYGHPRGMAGRTTPIGTGSSSDAVFDQEPTYVPPLPKEEAPATRSASASPNTSRQQPESSPAPQVVPVAEPVVETSQGRKLSRVGSGSPSEVDESGAQVTRKPTIKLD